MNRNSAMPSVVPISGSRSPRFRTIAGAALLVSMGSAVLVGCGKTAIPTRPVMVHYDPDLKAYWASLYWGEPVSIGGMRAGEARPSRSAGATRVAHDINTVVVGTEAIPMFQVTTQGVSGAYRAHIYIDDQLWWDVAGQARTSPLGSVYHYGKTWVPADTGVHVLRMIVDPDSLVAEVDETNNELRLDVKVILGDLRCAILHFIQWRDNYPYQVDEVQVNTPVDIVVLTAADGSYPNHREVLDACGTVLLDRRADMSGGTLYSGWRLDTLQFTPASTGTCQVRFDVDPDGEFPNDRDRRDNTSTRTLTVRP